jgi:hypothetical protein
MAAGQIPGGRLPLRVGLGVGLVAGSTLALQVLLTRLFSAVLFYHFAFLAISLALLGIGAGAILIYVRPRWFERGGVESMLALWCAALAVLLLVVPAVLVRIDYPLTADVDFGFVTTLALAAVLSALPFLAAGIVIAMAIKHYVGSIGRLYAFDLAGAGVGALAVVPLMWVLDPQTLIVGLGAVTAFAAAMFAWSRASWRWAGIALGAAGAVVALVSSGTSLYYLEPRQQLLGDVDEHIADRWSPLSRVIGYPPATDSLGSPQASGAITYDLDLAPVPEHRPGEPPRGWRALELGPQSIGYELTGPGRALIIGGGGGRDIHNALSSGQREIDVIELNRAIREVVDEDLGEWSGAPYSLPRVNTKIGDGRSTLAATDRRYDQVHIGFTNTLSANAASSFALTENNLYTLEAFEEYLDHLRPGGVLNLSRLRFFTGEEALRVTVLVLEALRRYGVADPQRNVVVVLGEGAGGVFATTLARLEPYTEAELREVRRLARERGLGVVFAPGGPYRDEWAALARADSPAAFCAAYRANVCPPTDDRPFFFNQTRLTDLGQSAAGHDDYLPYAQTPYVVLLVTLGILAALCLLAFALPLAAVRGAGRPSVSSLMFFAAIGVGFLTLEIVLIQRFVLFLGFPTYALSVVLFSLLVFTGIGSLLSERWRGSRRALLVSLSLACVLIAASAIGLQGLLRGLIDLPFAARIAIAVALLAPAGLTLGMAMPIGLRRLAGLYPMGVPWAWGINGITSVLASVLAIAIAITWGFTAATLIALGCYLGALGHAALGRWPDAAIPVEDEPGPKPAAAVPQSAPATSPAARGG